MRKLGPFGPTLIGFFIGVAVTAVLTYFLYFQNAKPFKREQRIGQIQFINPLLDCPGQPEGNSPNKALLRKKLEGLIHQAEVEDNGISNVAVYFRDLNNGPTFGINSRDLFVGASLMKLPVLIWYLKDVSFKPNLMEEKVAFKHQMDEKQIVQTIGSYTDLKEGEMYTVKDLLEMMITESNNEASNALQSHLQINIVGLLEQMGVPVTITNGELYISVEDYASLFRILYNATYLDQEKSNWALGLLSKAKFQDGLVAGVDPQIPVAHKFGERGINSSKYFHDCGIVYYPKRPYLLCVMTRGTNGKNMIGIVKDISKAVFDQIKSDAD
jgi:beta-lactamase class A